MAVAGIQYLLAGEAEKPLVIPTKREPEAGPSPFH